MNEQRLVSHRFNTGSNDEPSNSGDLEPAVGRTTDQLNGNRIIPLRECVHAYKQIYCTGWEEMISVYRPGVSGKPNTCHSHVDN